MTEIEDRDLEVDLERERIMNEDEDLTFTEIRARMSEKGSEQPEATAKTEDSDEDEEPVSTEEEDTEEVEESEDEPEAEEVEPEEKAVEKVVESTSHKIKANGTEYDFTTDELKALAPKAMDYTKKMQEIAPWRKTISALKEQGLGESDVNLMIDVLRGDKAAIEEVLKRTKVDPLDLDTESKAAYVPNTYGKDETYLAIEDIINQIKGDAEYATTSKVVDDVWDSRSRQTMAQNPDMIMGLHQDIKNGVYSKVAPLAEKMKVLDGGRLSDLDYYVEAGNKFYANTQNTEVKEVARDTTRQTEIKAMASKRKAASPTKSSSGERDIIDYLDDNDEDYDSWYKKTMRSR